MLVVRGGLRGSLADDGFISSPHVAGDVQSPQVTPSQFFQGAEHRLPATPYFKGDAQRLPPPATERPPAASEPAKALPPPVGPPPAAGDPATPSTPEQIVKHLHGAPPPANVGDPACNTVNTANK